MSNFLDSVMLDPDDKEKRQRFVETQALLLEVEPEEAALMAFATNLTKEMAIRFDRLPRSFAEVDKTFRANKLAYDVWQALTSDSARSVLSDAMVAVTGFDPKAWHDGNTSPIAAQTPIEAQAKSDYMTLANESLARRWMDVIVDLSHDEPQQAAKLLNQVESWLGDKLDKTLLENRINEAALLTLEAEPQQLPKLQPLINKLLSAKDLERLNRWAELLWASSDENLRDWLSRELAVRLDVGVEEEVSVRIAEIRKRLERTGRQRFLSRRQLLDRWLTSRDELQAIVNSKDLPEADLQLIVDVASWTTTALALNENRLEIFREYSRESAAKLVDLARSEFQTQTVVEFGNRGKQAHSTHRDTFRKAMDTLQQDGPDIRVKADALQQLFSVADRFDDVDFEDGQKLIDYLFNAQSDDEVVLIRQRLAEIQHWPNLWLALINKLDSSEGLVRDRTVTIASLLAGRRIVLDQESPWYRQLQLQLMKIYHASCSYSRVHGGQYDPILWEHLRVSMGLETQKRLALLTETVEGEQSLIKLNQYLANKLEIGHSLNHQWTTIEFLATNELHRLVLVGRVVVQQVANEVRMQNPQIDNRIALIQSWHKEQAGSLATYQQQLLLNEITLLKIWVTACQAN